MSEDTKSALGERNLAVADAAHQHHREALRDSFGSVITFSAEALKTAALINGGSAAAALAFISQTIDKKQPLALALVDPLKAFGWGLLMAVIATGVAYLSQACVTTSSSKDEYTNKQPYIVETKASRDWRDAGIALQVFSILLIVGAYASALYGFCAAAIVLERAAL